jgi:hypothetical protein
MAGSGTDRARLAVLVAVAVALAAALWALSAGGKAARQGKARAADAAALEAEAAAGKGARAWLARAAEGDRADLAAAAKAVFGSGARVTERERLALPEGWEKRTVEVESGGIPLEKTAEFLEAAREGTAPWRLAEAVVESADRPGRGTVRLVFTTLAPAE